ncbi:uroporphyrinogen-III C-methyltransferase [Malassezia cuniculi]|uniref:precorrin-2 dehydrogenase n=1 Tax=Malassezia cuniculi TaxID=948313 RepID=A0AAF0EQQ9_9BASI|nr:uroporphyrinogen-III C-methyltransferase [Malassezia cuniculi]
MAASLILAHRLEGRRVLIVGDRPSACARVKAVREAGGEPVIVWLDAAAHTCCEGPIHKVVESHVLFPDAAGDVEDAWAALVDSVDVDGSLMCVCVTDTQAKRIGERREAALRRCQVLATLCKRRRILLNVTDEPRLCDFSFPATHRFAAGDEQSSLQVSVATNGRGCRLAGRIRRQIIESLPADVGLAVERIGEMRRMARLGTVPCNAPNDAPEDCHEDDPRMSDAALGYASPEFDVRQRRMQWIAQISEYWPLESLASLTKEQMTELLNTAEDNAAGLPKTKRAKTESSPVQSKSMGHIFLLGAGPGHPGLLTVAAHSLLTSPNTDLVLSDKLVPAQVLALIPRATPLVIAKKFPGNADGAQSELIAQALEAARQGKVVVRLKQGDPFVYGRGGEELLACKNAGIPCTVLPGISSALAGPLMFDVPVTQRGASDSLALCTGVGRGGSRVSLYGYERGRTLLILMGVARLRAVVETLVTPDVDAAARSGAPYPPYMPIAVIERASSSDQRMIASTLDRIVEVIEERLPDGPRPPSMLIVGWTLLSLAGERAGNGVLDDASSENVAQLDQERVRRWLGNDGYRITEGLPAGFASLDALVPAASTDTHAVPRDASGWAPPRYSDRPTGGWTPGE